jgi:tetratricopeptide (TPR) repeat protein
VPGHLEDRARQVVPRWRTFSASVDRGELLSLAERAEPVASDEMIGRNISEWSVDRTVSVGADLLSVAFTLGRYEVAQDAAQFLLAEGVSEPLRGVAMAYLAKGERPMASSADAEFSVDTLRRDIARFRVRLRGYPRNPILWAQLGRVYSSLGVFERAERAVRTAVSLAPDNRFIVRSASRFYLHVGDAQRAAEIVRRAVGVRSDPWLLAAEIALADAAGKSSRLIKDARELVDARRYSPNHVSELASALATIEAASGNRRAAQKLIRQSLDGAAENATAQAAWLRRNFSSLNTAVVPTGSSWEARAWTAQHDGQWNIVIKESSRWQADEPFSSRPALVGSHAAIMTEQFDHAISVLNLGLLSNPNDFTLRNNLAYSYAEKGHTKEAIAVFKGVKREQLSSHEAFVFDATLGLIAFRTGDVALGCMLYERAISGAERIRDRGELLARIHYILELVRSRQPAGVQMRDHLLSGDYTDATASVKTLIARLRRTKDAAASRR